jgi:3''-phosphoadenosine 5''-phosphosulfate sulfotransferase (PAPS reductase)/FAD synthetase and related enzymes
MARFLPILDWSDDHVRRYRQLFNLPAHPLDSDGRLSIGCEPCTDLSPTYLGLPMMPAQQDRSNRWVGLEKKECGLHLQSAYERTGMES